MKRLTRAMKHKSKRVGDSALRLLVGCAAALAAAALRAEPAAGLPPKLDLGAAIQYALQHNYSILQAREAIRQQEGVIVATESAALPNVTATGQYQRNQLAVSQTFPQSNASYAANVKATQTLVNLGTLAALKAARVTRDAAQAQLEATIDAALLDVRTRFYTVLLDRDKVRVQEENVELFRHQLGDTRNQLQAGTVSSFELLRAQVSLANAEPDLITARNDYRVALEQLRQSLGIPSGPGGAAELPEVEGSLDQIAPETIGLPDALESARAHRPELVQLEKQTEAEEDAVSNAKAGYYPTAQAFGEYEWDGFSGFTQPPGSFGFPPHASGWLFGVQANWAIFDGRATHGRIEQARSQLEQARLSEASEDLAIDVEVRQDYSAYVQAQELVGATRQTVRQAEEALRLANERFHVGSATQLDVLTSQVALTQARTNQLQANYNYLVSLATLRKAMGLEDALLGG